MRLPMQLPEEGDIQELKDQLYAYRKFYDQLTTLKHIVFTSAHESDSEAIALIFSKEIKENMDVADNSIWLCKGKNSLLEISRNGTLVDSSQRRRIEIDSSDILKRVFNDQLMYWPEDGRAVNGIFADFQAPLIFPIKAQHSALGIIILDQRAAVDGDLFQFVAQFAGIIIERAFFHDQILEQKDELGEVNEILFTQNAQLSSLHHLGMRVIGINEPVKVCQVISDIVVEDLGAANAVAFIIIDEDSDLLTGVSQKGGLSNLTGFELPIHEIPPIQQCLESGRIVDHKNHSEAIRLRSERLDNWVIFPFKRGEKAIGVLIAEIEEKDITDSIYILVNYASIILDNLMLQKKAEEKIKRYMKEIEVANTQLREFNQKIMDSIYYAQLIQKSLLPNMDILKHNLPQSFVIWQPKDVVGGDILFADFFPQGFILAVVDCTGHGVPGAFMTMIASSGLRQIISDEGCRHPADILKHLNYFVKKSLRQDTDLAPSDDGLDIALCLFDRETGGLTFSGARIPLMIVQNGKLRVIKGDKQSIGYKKSQFGYDYTTHELHVEHDMSFYLFTDGITGQMGGEKGRSFGSVRFKRLLVENYQAPFEEQQQKLLKAFDDYTGHKERTDDITVVGFQLGPS